MLERLRGKQCRDLKLTTIRKLATAASNFEELPSQVGPKSIQLSLGITGCACAPQYSESTAPRQKATTNIHYQSLQPKVLQNCRRYSQVSRLLYKLANKWK